MKCKFCQKEFESSRSITNHQTKCKENPDRHVIVIKDKEAFRQKMKDLNKIMWTAEARKKLSVSMIEAHKNGRAWNIGKQMNLLGFKH